MRSQSEIRLAVIGYSYMNPPGDAIAGIAAGAGERWPAFTFPAGARRQRERRC